jgi:hypothetical protein
MGTFLVWNVTTDEQAFQVEKLLHTFTELNEDNRDILIGKSKELLKEQHRAEADDLAPKKLPPTVRPDNPIPRQMARRFPLRIFYGTL